MKITTKKSKIIKFIKEIPEDSFIKGHTIKTDNKNRIILNPARALVIKKIDNRTIEVSMVGDCSFTITEIIKDEHTNKRLKVAKILKFEKIVFENDIVNNIFCSKCKSNGIEVRMSQGKIKPFIENGKESEAEYIQIYKCNTCGKKVKVFRIKDKINFGNIKAYDYQTYQDKIQKIRME